MIIYIYGELTGSEVESVVIYETKAADAYVAGSGVVLTGGGKVIEFLDMYDEFHKLGAVLNHITHMNAYGEAMYTFSLHSIFKKSKSPLLQSSSEHNSFPLSYFFSREAMQVILEKAIQNDTYSRYFPKEIQDLTKVHLRANTTVTSVYEYEENGKRKAGVKLADGTIDDGYDYVLGCDGIRSNIRNYIQKEYCAINKDEVCDQGGSRYSGIRMGILATGPDPNFELRPTGKNMTRQWYGNGVYVMETTMGGVRGVQQVIGVSFRADDDSKLGENANWKDERERIQIVLREKLAAGGLDKPEILTVLENAQHGIDIGIRDNPKPYKTWSSSSGRVVVVGDSAHKM